MPETRGRLIAAQALLLLVLAGFGVVACQAAAGDAAPPVPVAAERTVAPATPMPAPTAVPTPDRAMLAFDGDIALDHVRAQMDIGPRPTGSEESRQTAAYILSALEELGWETETQPFEYQGVAAQNLVARAGEPDGPVFMFGAHYDTRLRADQDLDNPEAPVPGANDAGSGVAVLLELARVVDLDAVPGEVWLVFFDAEDNGHLDGWEYIAGSRYFVEQLDFDPEYLVLVDMVGDADQQLYLEQTSDATLQAHLWAIAAELGYGEQFIAAPGYSMIDDHTPFLERGIPAVDIIDFDYPYWHTVADTLDKVSAESLARVGRVLEAFLEAGAAYPADGR